MFFGSVIIEESISMPFVTTVSKHNGNTCFGKYEKNCKNFRCKNHCGSEFIVSLWNKVILIWEISFRDFFVSPAQMLNKMETGAERKR